MTPRFLAAGFLLVVNDQQSWRILEETLWKPELQFYYHPLAEKPETVTQPDIYVEKLHLWSGPV